MFIRRKEFKELVELLKVFNSRPYLLDIETFNGITTFRFVKNNEIFEINTLKIEDDRVLN